MTRHEVRAADAAAPSGVESAARAAGAAAPSGVESADRYTTLWDAFDQAAYRAPDRVAVRSPAAELTYGELARLVARACGGPLAELPPGSVVAGSLADPPRLLALVYACARLGLVLAPLDPRLKAAERARLLQAASPALVVDAATMGTLLGATIEIEHTHAPPLPNPYATMGMLLGAPVERPVARPPVSGETLFYLGFTSGSTGAPKGILRTQASWALSFAAMTAEFGLSDQDRVLAAGGLAYSFFLIAALHALSLGAEALCLEKFSAGRAIAAAERWGATTLYLVPTMARSLATELEGRQAPRSVHTVVVAGARWPAEERRRLQARLPHARLIEYYGSSEMGFVSVSAPAEFEARPGSVGRAFHTAEIAIRDPDGRDLGEGCEGIVYARSPLTYARLLGEPGTVPPRSASRAWVTAGDRGYRDGGYLYLIGRDDEQINVGGLKVFAAEVEQHLMAHPRVADAVAVGLEDPLRGQIVGAVVEPEVGARLSSAELRAWLRPRLSTHKLPQQLAVVPRLPRTLNGKPARARARELLMDASGRRGGR